MHVIYVHGVSERPDRSEFDKYLIGRREKFDKEVARPLGYSITSFEAAGWGDLCPKVPFRTRKGQPLGPTSAVAQTMGDPAEAALPDPVLWRDFVRPDGQVSAAPYLEAALLRSADLDAATSNSGMDLVAELERTDATIAPPAAGEAADQTLARILASRASAQAPTGQKLDNIAGTVVLNAIARSIELAAAPFGGRPRDVIARELAARWIDIVWYFGRGRNDVRRRVLNRFAEITKNSQHEPIVVLAHSLGGFIAHDAINSQAFLERGLEQRGPWILFCLGAQLTIYQKLGLMEHGLRLGSDLSGRVRYRNIVDPNDPLGFVVDEPDEPDLDVRVTSGANFIASHGTYLDSDIILRRLRSELRRLASELKIKPA